MMQDKLSAVTRWMKVGDGSSICAFSQQALKMTEQAMALCGMMSLLLQTHPVKIRQMKRLRDDPRSLLHLRSSAENILVSRSSRRGRLRSIYQRRSVDIGGSSSSCLRDIPLRYALAKAATMDPQLQFQDHFLEGLGLDPRKLRSDRRVPEHRGKIAFFRALEESSDQLLSQLPDVLSSKCKISKPGIIWKLKVL